MGFIEKNKGAVEKKVVQILTPQIPMEDESAYGEYVEEPMKQLPSALKYPIGHEPPLPEDEQPHEKKKASAKTPESLLLRSYSATLSTDGDLKSLSQVLSQKAKKPVSHSAILRALVHLAAHDPALIPKILSYVSHEEIKPGRK